MAGSIRFRLTVWYASTLALVLCLFAATAWMAMRSSVIETVDKDLRSRITDVKAFIQQEMAVSRSELDHEFGEHALLGLGGGLLQVTDAEGRLLYRSARVRAGQLPPLQPSARLSELTIITSGNGRTKLRVASQNVVANSQTFTVQVAEPLHEFDEAAERFGNVLLLAGPLFLVLASLGGYWISRRALSPVDRIIDDARHITIASLSSRLIVPTADDELKRLAQTPNEMLDRIERAVTRIVQFTADASHELRAPLTLIHTAAEFSLRRDRSRDDLVEAMRRIQRESHRTARIVDDLLLLARADSGNSQLCLVRTDLLISIRTAADQARSLAESRDLHVVTTIPERPAIVNADEEALSRLWLILLDNAVKYTELGGTIGISVQVHEATVDVTISDTGVGITRDDLPHVFERFWRADKVRSRAMGGAGLGLSIASWIAEHHSGNIEIHSEPGSGSNVVVHLPLERDGLANALQQSSETAGNQQSSVTI